MLRNTLLLRTLGVILAALLLGALLTGLAFLYLGSSAFTEIKAGELKPRAKYLAAVTGEYLRGDLSTIGYERAIGSGYHIWDAAMYAYDCNGKLFAYPVRSDNEANLATLSEYTGLVLGGESVCSSDMRGGRGDVVVGEPVVHPVDNRVIGAVFLIKPLTDLNTASSSLFFALIISMVASFALMIVPVYFGIRNIINPIREMTAAATAMANGDFTVKASVEGSDEVARLGSSLNHLSNALSSTINDLTLEKDRLNAVINGLGEGIVALDQDGRVIKVNRSAPLLMGGLEGDDVTMLPAYEACREDIARLLRGEKQLSREADVRSRRLSITMTALGSDSGSRGVVMLIQDVTEAYRLEQTRIEYVANVSHELRTPIASIRGLADALNDGLVKKDEDKARYYGYILHESMRLSRLIDDLLELSRIQSGSVALRRQRVDLAELIYDLADRFAAPARERGLSISVDIASGCERVYTNPDRAEQVLVILLDNALKHGGSGGGICLSARPHEGRAVIGVSNPGSIASEDIDHVFERFYKADKAHSGRGTGLGLSIASEVLKLMGESIWVTSADSAVTFSFTLELCGQPQ